MQDCFWTVPVKSEPCCKGVLTGQLAMNECTPYSHWYTIHIPSRTHLYMLMRNTFICAFIVWLASAYNSRSYSMYFTCEFFLHCAIIGHRRSLEDFFSSFFWFIHWIHLLWCVALKWVFNWILWDCLCMYIYFCSFPLFWYTSLSHMLESFILGWIDWVSFQSSQC